MSRTQTSLLFVSVIIQSWVPLVHGENRAGRQRHLQQPHKRDVQLIVPRDAQLDWLEARLLENISSRRQRQIVHTKLKRMSPDQIAALVLYYERQLRRKAARIEDLQWQRQHVGRNIDHRHWGRRIRYVPVISWLPQGTSFQTSGLVSADRRSVRISANPLFSRIDRVDLYPLYGYPHQNVARRQRNTQNAKPQVWYDGLRTRYDNLSTRTNRR